MLAVVQVGGSVVTTHSSLEDGMVCIFDRDYNRPDPLPGAKEWDTIRDLEVSGLLPGCLNLRQEAGVGD